MPSTTPCRICGGPCVPCNEDGVTIVRCETCGLSSDVAEAQLSGNVQVFSILHLNFRYTGAWAEYNQRLMARHHVVGLYLTASALVLSFLYANREIFLPSYCIVSMVIPVASVIAALILHMHDCIMSELHVFLIKCELFNNVAKHSDGRVLPSYHAPQKSVRNFLISRQLYTFILLGIFSLLNASPIFIIFVRILSTEISTYIYIILYFVFYFLMFFVSWSLIRVSMHRRVEAMIPYMGTFKLPTFPQRVKPFFMFVLKQYLTPDDFDQTS